MLPLVNRYSYLIASALAMSLAWLVGARFGGVWPSVAVAGVGISMALVQRKLRGGHSNAGTWDEVSAEIGSGRPLLLFLYSDT